VTVEIGHFALILALTLALVQTVVPFVGARRGDPALMGVGAGAAFAQFVFIAVAFAALARAHLTSDFSVVNVAENSHSALPAIYKFSGVWGNHEGSMLLWVLILSLFGALVALFGNNLPTTLKAHVLAVQSWIACAFYLFILLTSNPFLRLAQAPIEGRDLNPILQDIGLAIHPPLLYLGYVGFSMAFSFAVAALIEGRVDASWARWVRPWTLAAWTCLTVGIGLGSMLCEKLSGKHVEIGLVPFGSIGLTLFGCDLYFASPTAIPAGAPLAIVQLLAQPSTWRVLFDLFGLCVFGGFFIVPLYVLIQLRSAPEHRARIIAANNILNALFMVVGALMAAGLLGKGVTIPELFGMAALCNALVAIYIYSLVPEFLLRFVAWLLVHTVYRLDQKGIENIPEEGPAILVCNHVSYVDALVISSACRRPIRFVMDHHIFNAPLIGPIFRHVRAIPIAPANEDAALMEAAFDEVARALEAGDLVAIFPEGGLTTTGELQPFRPGIQRIVSRTPVPVIPMALRGLWGSFFSRHGGTAMGARSNLRPFSAIGLHVGEAIAPDQATPEHLRALVQALRAGSQ